MKSALRAVILFATMILATAACGGDPDQVGGVEPSNGHIPATASTIGVTAGDSGTGGSSGSGGSAGTTVAGDAGVIPGCVTGAQVFCACPWTSHTGIQVCNASHTYDACTGCPAVGTGGNSGTGGSSGSSGSAGSTVTGGNSGTGGTIVHTDAGSDVINVTADSGAVVLADAGSDAISVTSDSGTVVADSGVAVCTPTVIVTTLYYASDTVMPGSEGYNVLSANIAVDGCSDVEIAGMSFGMNSADFADSYDAAHCKAPCASPGDYNFRNVRVTDRDHGGVVAGPLGNFKRTPYNGMQTQAVFNESFKIEKYHSKNIGLVMDVPAPLATDVTNHKFSGWLSFISTTTPNVKVIWNDISGGNRGFTVVPAQEMLRIELDTTSPSPSIVVGGKSFFVPFSNYRITNMTSKPVSFYAANLVQADQNGDNADFTQVGLAVDGNLQMASSAVDPYTGYWVAGGIADPYTVTVPAQSSINAQTWGAMAAVMSGTEANGQWHGVARSGHTPRLAIAGVKISVPNAVYTQPAYTSLPAVRVLRKSVPVVTKQQLMATSLIFGDQDLIKWQVCADPIAPVAFKVMSFTVEKHGACTAHNFHVRDMTGDLSAAYVETSGAAGGSGDWFYAGDSTMETWVIFNDEEVVTSCKTYAIHALLENVQQDCVFTVTANSQDSGDITQITARLGHSMNYPSLVGAGAVLQHWIWSDMSEKGLHYAAQGGPMQWNGNNSSMDWTNGLYVQGLPFTQVLVK
jgi:hypothetical protein